MLTDILTFALEIGTLIALTALGYALIFSVLKFINFAHGELITVGAYAGALATSSLKTGLFLTTLVAFLVTGTLGVVIERLAFRRLRASRLSMFLSSFGVALVLNGVISLAFSSTARRVDILGSQATLRPINLLGLVVILATIATWVLNRTKFGLGLRALAADESGAELVGIQPDSLISVTFFVASGLAGVAGLILALTFGATPDLGGKYGIWAFAVVLMAGFGSVIGIIAVSLASGCVLGGVTYFFGNYSYGNAVLFGLMALTLLFRPNGLFGAELRRF